MMQKLNCFTNVNFVRGYKITLLVVNMKRIFKLLEKVTDLTFI